MRAKSNERHKIAFKKRSVLAKLKELLTQLQQKVNEGFHVIVERIQPYTYTSFERKKKSKTD